MTPFYLAHLVMQLALPRQSDADSTMPNFETELEMLQVPNSRTRMLQVGDRVLKIGADEVGRVCRVEGTKVVVERAAGGRRFHLQSATNFYRLDDAAGPRAGEMRPCGSDPPLVCCRPHACDHVRVGGLRERALGRISLCLCRCTRLLLLPADAAAAAREAFRL